MSKIRLTKAAPSVSLTKQGASGGRLRVNLQWAARSGPEKRGGLFGKRRDSDDIDLDLACLWELTDGDKGVVQALGNSFESPGRTGPVVRLDGDDRSGANSAGENLLVDLTQQDLIRRILVFAFIYEGTPNWAGADGVVTLHPVSGPQIEVRLDEHDPGSRFCVVAMIDNSGGELTVRREVRYIQGGQRELDRAYGWGLRWAAGRK